MNKMVKLKENVFGFTYDSEYGNVQKIFTQPLTENEIKLVNKVLSEDDVLFTDNEDINSMFEFDCKEDLESDVEGLNTSNWIRLDLSLSCKIDIKIKDNKVKFIFEDITIYDKVFGSTSEYALGSNYTIYLNGFITNTMLEYGINEKNVKNRIYETNNFTSSRLYALDYIINGINEALFQNINKNIRESNF